MNVVLITRFYPPDTGGGGIAAYARYLAIGLRQAGHNVRVISQQAEDSKPRQMVNGVEVHRIQPSKIPYRYHRLPVLGGYHRFLNDLSYAWAVRRKLLQLSSQQPPDIVEYADIDAEGLFHPSEVCPAVVKLHTPHFVLKRFYSERESPYYKAPVERIEKKAILNANGISSPSKYLARAITEKYNLPKTSVTYVPNLIDTDFFSPDQSEKNSSTRVLYVGRLEPRKGAVVFSRAIPIIAEQFPEVRFVFLGTDRPSPTGASQKAELKAYLENQGVSHQIEFYGHAPPKKFLEHYRRAAVFVMPSLFENCPYTLLEAMACGKPSVVSRAYGMMEMIKHGESGYFFAPEDPDDLAKRTIQLLGKPSLCEKLGEGARARVLNEYSLDAGTEKTLAFYRSVLTQR